MEKYKYVGKTREEALNMALYELNVNEENVIINEKEQKGGLFKGKKIELEIIKKEDIINFIKETLVNITTKMGLEVKLEVLTRDETPNIVIHSDNNNILIGKNGRSLSALTMILKQAVFNEIGQNFRFNLDVADYKLKQQRNLERLAKKVAREVSRTKIDANLEPMNSYERRIVHSILSNNKKVYTESTGEEPNRYVVIKAKEDESEE